MDIFVILAVLVAVGLLCMVLVVAIGAVALLLALTATVMLDVGANLSAVLVGRPRSHRL